MVLGELDSYMQKKKNETRPPIYTIHQNKLKMDKRLKHSRDTIKVLEENIDRKISDIPHSSIFTDMSPRHKGKKKQMGCHQNKKLLHG